MEQTDQRKGAASLCSYPAANARGSYQLPDDDRSQNDRVFWHQLSSVKDEQNSMEVCASCKHYVM